MSLALAAHKAVHDALVANGRLVAMISEPGKPPRVYDRAPGPLPKYPYIVIGQIDIIGDGNTCSDSSIVNVTPSVWSNAVGKQEAEEIGDLVREILAPESGNGALDIVGYDTVVSEFQTAVYRPGDDPLLTEGILAFTYQVDPA